jgi:hypothetical protein
MYPVTEVFKLIYIKIEMIPIATLAGAASLLIKKEVYEMNTNNRDGKI